MRWQWKASILRQLSHMPGGKRAYLMAQKLCGTTRVQPKRDLTRAVELIGLIQEAGQKVTDSVCYEVGTGWHPFTPLGFYLAGARTVVTIDVNPWLSLKAARMSVQSIEPFLEWFADRCGLKGSEVKSRYERIDINAETLPELLSSFGCEYQYPGDATDSGQPAQRFDFVISSNVLEHVPPQILRGIAAEGMRILKAGGLFVHRFNPGDHYANSDASISTANFLRFSSEQWAKYGDGLAYHNRLRCSQYQKLFAEVGFLPLIEQTRVDPDALESIEHSEIPVHSDFAALSTEDLASDYMWYVGMNPTAVVGQTDSQSESESGTGTEPASTTPAIWKPTGAI